MNATASDSPAGSHKAARPRAALLVAAICWGAAGVLYLASEGVAAVAFRPSYSYARNYISDLGLPTCGVLFEGRAVCSPLYWLVNADFVVQGMLFVAAALAVTRMIVARSRAAFAVAALANGIGISLVGLVPETAAPAGVHPLGAFLAIVGGNATALISAFAFRELGLPRIHRLASLALPLVAATALAMLLVARARGGAVGVPDGVWERASVYTITAWELLTAACLAARRRDGGAPAA